MLLQYIILHVCCDSQLPHGSGPIAAKVRNLAASSRRGACFPDSSGVCSYNEMLWIFRLRVLRKIDSIGILLSVYQHTQNRSCDSFEGPNNMYQKWQYRDTAPPTHHQREKNNCGRRVNQRCTIMTKLVFVFQPACLCPNSCATNDDRQMRMTDTDTPQCSALRDPLSMCVEG